MIRRAAAEITGKSDTVRWLRWVVPVFGTAAVVVIVAGFLATLDERRKLIDNGANAPVVASAQQPAAILAAEVDPELDSTTAEPEVSLDEQLHLAEGLTDSESAFIALLDLWGLDYRGDERVCAQVATSGYECLFQRGSWSGLKQFDRPAVLTLIDNSGAAHNVVLTAITGETVELSIGGVAVTHPIDDVSDMWFGRYMLLWRPPNGSFVALGPGSSSTSVVWLRQSLAAIDPRYRTQAMDSDVFDSDLREQVRAFQRDHRLDVDGLAGHKTQIIMNTLLAPDNTPRLTIPRLAQE
jgi:general secretion pathway protein A